MWRCLREAIHVSIVFEGDFTLCAQFALPAAVHPLGSRQARALMSLSFGNEQGGVFSQSFKDYSGMSAYGHASFLGLS